MRLLRCDAASRLSLTKDSVGDGTIPPYAILSHTWTEGQEVTFQDLVDGTGEDKHTYNKLRFCAERAAGDDLQHFWVDTCCIGKSNPSEVSRDINAMFRYYRSAVCCYVYLADVSHPAPGKRDEHKQELWELELRRCRWFTRVWTLQELLAPYSVVLFTCKPMRNAQYKRLGDRCSLQRLIHEVTGKPISALAGSRLSRFGFEERLMWSEHRQITNPEDKVYSLFGIFDIEMPLFYGEGAAQAYQRLLDIMKERRTCMQNLHITNPRTDKERSMATKGGLLAESCCWIFKKREYEEWRSGGQHGLLWIKGDPGKGKTMLLCGIIDKLEKSATSSTLMSSFFCQATDSQVSSATSVLSSLIYMLVEPQPSPVSHVQKRHESCKIRRNRAPVCIRAAAMRSAKEDDQLRSCTNRVGSVECLQCVSVAASVLSYAKALRPL